VVRHGTWTAWLQENVKFSEAQAKRYMRIAQGWDAISGAGNLTLRKTLQLLGDREGVG